MQRAPATLHGVVFDIWVGDELHSLAFAVGFGAAAFTLLCRSLTFGGVGRSI